MSSKNWPRDPYSKDGEAMSPEEIKNMWNVNGKVQSSRGTLMHAHIEHHINADTIELPHSVEFVQFLDFWKHEVIDKKLVPFMTEASLFHIGLGCAGQADLLCHDEHGDVVIIDWKRSKEIKLSNRWQHMHFPIEAMDDCNYNHYCLQLNLYKYMLETEYDLKVSKMQLAIFHPNQETYKEIEVPSLPKEMSAIIEHEMATGRAKEPVPGEDAPWQVCKRPASPSDPNFMFVLSKKLKKV